MFRFLVVFMIVQLGLFTAELTAPLQKAIVIPFTESIAAISAWMMKLFDPNVGSNGIVLFDLKNGFAVSIEAGCNGVEATIVLIAAMIAFPSPWRMKLLGITIGFFTIQAMNLLRIVSLFYIGQWSEVAFEWAHLYIWQALIMLDVLIVFLIWLRYLPQQHESADAA